MRPNRQLSTLRLLLHAVLLVPLVQTGLGRDSLAQSATGANPFAPAKPPPQTPPTHRVHSTIEFAAVGDFGVYQNKYPSAVARLIRSWNPDFIITLGDNNYELQNNDPRKRSYRAVTGHYYCDWILNVNAGGQACRTPSLSKNRFFPCLGNHDWEDHRGRGKLGTYGDFFDLPGQGYSSTSGNERYYDYRIGAVHFFVLSTNTYHEPDGTTQNSKQASWLEDGLKHSSATWRFVYFHKPPYTSSQRGAAKYMRWPFARWGADVVMSGHDHFYERLRIDGIPYFVNGSGGGGITSNVPHRIQQSQVLYTAPSGFGAMRITASPSTMRFRFVDIRGIVRDDHVISKRRPAAVRSVGSGCASGRLPILSATLPRLNGNMSISISQAPRRSPGIHVIGTPHPGIAIGSTCVAYLDLSAQVVSIPLQTDPVGTWRSPCLPVGTSVALLGRTYAWQSWIQAPPPGRTALTNGLWLTIGQ